MKTHLFLIDDDEDELSIFTEAMQNLTCAAKRTYAQSAAQALDMLNYLSPDYIFIDINMPKVNGYDCVKKIRSKPGLTNACIVLYSTGIDESAISRATSAGANYCMPKTSTIEELSKNLNALINPVVTFSVQQ